MYKYLKGNGKWETYSEQELKMLCKAYHSFEEGYMDRTYELAQRLNQSCITSRQRDLWSHYQRIASDYTGSTWFRVVNCSRFGFTGGFMMTDDNHNGALFCYMTENRTYVVPVYVLSIKKAEMRGHTNIIRKTSCVEPLPVNTPVTILDGYNVIDYVGGWTPNMQYHIGEEHFITKVIKYAEGYYGYRLNNFDYIVDARYVEKIPFLKRPCDERVEWEGNHYWIIAYKYYGDVDEDIIEEVGGNTTVIQPTEPWCVVDGYRVKVSTVHTHPEWFYFCYLCGSLHFKTEDTKVDGYGHKICDECAETRCTVCTDCGRLFANDDIRRIADEDDRPVCVECAQENYTICPNCGRVYSSDEHFHTVNDYGLLTNICDTCFRRNYRVCDGCGEYVRRSEIIYDVRDDSYYCSECYEPPVKHIHSYHHSHNDEPTFHGEGRKDISVELEVERGDSEEWERNEDAGQVIELLDGHVHCEHDGSLQQGYEIITDPHTYDEFFKLKWKETFEYLKEHGYTSHNNGRCGLHIHVSNEWFGDNSFEIDDNVSKVVHLYSAHYNFFFDCSRRTDAQAEEWANEIYCDSFEHAKEVKNGRGRYHAVNLTNMNTIGTVEFRLGRGTLRFESFKAWVDIHAAIVKNVRNMEKNDTDLNKWLSGISEGTKAYIKERTGIEIVDTEREVA